MILFLPNCSRKLVQRRAAATPYIRHSVGLVMTWIEAEEPVRFSVTFWDKYSPSVRKHNGWMKRKVGCAYIGDITESKDTAGQLDAALLKLVYNSMVCAEYNSVTENLLKYFSETSNFVYHQ